MLLNPPRLVQSRQRAHAALREPETVSAVSTREMKEGGNDHHDEICFRLLRCAKRTDRVITVLRCAVAYNMPQNSHVNSTPTEVFHDTTFLGWLASSANCDRGWTVEKQSVTIKRGWLRFVNRPKCFKYRAFLAISLRHTQQAEHHLWTHRFGLRLAVVRLISFALSLVARQ